MRYLAASSAQNGLVAGLPILLVSIILIAIGAVMAFDLFGFVTKNRVPPNVKSVEIRESLNLPEVPTLVGAIFLCVGGTLFVLVVVVEVIALVR